MKINKVKQIPCSMSNARCQFFSHMKYLSTPTLAATQLAKYCNILEDCKILFDCFSTQILSNTFDAKWDILMYSNASWFIDFSYLTSELWNPLWYPKKNKHKNSNVIPMPKISIIDKSEAHQFRRGVFLRTCKEFSKYDYLVPILTLPITAIVFQVC